MRRRSCSLSVAIVACLVLTGADWPRFRGPDGSGTSADKGLPLKWSDSEGVVWKTELPGRGSSSPITAGKRVFVTCYSGYGMSDRNPGEQEKLLRHLICVDRASGGILWDKPVKAKLPEAQYSGIGVPHHGYASSTPVTDGERVYAFFGKSGVVAFDVEGKKLWEKETGSGTHFFGSGASPILYKNLLIVQSTVENEALVAFDKVTGKEAWKVPASGYGGWSTPVLVDVEGGRKELVIKVPGEIWGLNPENGKLRWYVGGFGGGRGGGATCTSVVAHRGIVYGLGGRGSPSAAVRAGGRGDVSETRVVWKSNVGAYVPSPAIHDGHLYWASDRIATCLKLDTGKEVYRERLEGARDLYASVVIADGKIYAVSRWNGTFVLAAKPRFEPLAHNIFDSDESDFNASPAVSDGQLLLRSDRFLYCLGDTKKSKTAGGG